MSTTPQPFRLHVDDAAIADLRERLGRTRFPEQAPGEPWAHGTDVAYLRELVEHWGTGFDWRAQEARLNAFPQFTVPLNGIDLHFLKVEGRGPRPLPLLLAHGWPGSVFEFLDLIPRLVDPARFGGDPADAFTVMPCRPSAPSFRQRSAGKRLSRSISAARGAISSDANWRTVARRSASSSPCGNSRTG